VYDSVISNNVANSRLLEGDWITGGVGGGISVVDSSASIETTEFTNNVAGRWGGGACFESSGVSVSASLFEDNRVYDGGAGLSTFKSNATIEDTVFRKNGAYSEDLSSYYGGGGCYFDSSRATVSKCGFFDNVYEYAGGGISTSESNLHVMDTDFDNNTLTDAARVRFAAYGAGIMDHSSSTIKVERSTFTRGWASYGGALYFTRSMAITVSDSVMADNDAIWSGGALYPVSTKHP
jgi:hypothetical protein